MRFLCVLQLQSEFRLPLCGKYREKVEKLDARQQELMAKLAEPPGADFGDLMRESAIVQDKLDAATALWEEAMEKLEEILAANAAIHED